MITQLTVVGAGLIGGSLIRALREQGAVQQVVVCNRNANALTHSLKLGIIDRVEIDLALAVKEADIVVIATPAGAIADLICHMADKLRSGAVVTDVGSIKGAIINSLQKKLGEIPNWFVPGHPVAGTEKSGIDASFAGLFVGRKVILTPLENTDSQAVAKVCAMWQTAGAQVVNMSVAQHDNVLAATSHLPHMLAYALVNQLASMNESAQIFRFAAGGFRDLSRIASSDPAMWRDICLGNADSISSMIGSYQNYLADIKSMIERKDATALYEFFASAKQVRDEHFE